MARTTAAATPTSVELRDREHELLTCEPGRLARIRQHGFFPVRQRELLEEHAAWTRRARGFRGAPGIHAAMLQAAADTRQELRAVRIIGF